MGSSESKVSVNSTPKPSQGMKRDRRVAQLVDPRSPTEDINRTPIQVGGAVSRIPDVSGCPVSAVDPRSPSVYFARTPLKESMRATVGSIACRLGIFRNSDYAVIASPSPLQKCPNLEEEVAAVVDELGSNQPLLSPQSSQVSGDVILSPQTLPSPQKVSSEMCLTQSPFLLLGAAEVEVEADISVDEAEEARESPLSNRLSMSLITCHDAPYQIHAEVHQESPASPHPDDDGVSSEHRGEQTDQPYSVSSKPAQPMPAVPEPSSLAVTQETEVTAAPPLPTEAQTTVSEPATPTTQASPVEPSFGVSSPGAAQPQPQTTGIRCPTFDTKSPSQVVFKPQWLGKGFGVTGARAKGRGGKVTSSSSPLAIRVGTKNIGNENQGQAVKPKHRGKPVLAEGRSPLQMLRETNSPRGQATQIKQKVSTPDRQRLGQLDRRVLSVSVDKEN